MGSFVEEQKAVNTQANLRIDTVESTLNKKIENLQSNLAQKFDNLQYSIFRLTNRSRCKKKESSPLRHSPILGECMN